MPQNIANEQSNLGSRGSYSKDIQARLRYYQDRAEAEPDCFIRYEYPSLLDESRQAIADLLRVSVSTVVYLPNATTAINVILRNVQWHIDGKDEILYFDTIYGGFGKTIDYIVDTNPCKVAGRSIHITYPCEDDVILQCFCDAVKLSRKAGQRPKMCIFDAVSSRPGVRFPFEAMTRLCKELGIASVVDGAQAVGMIDLDIRALDPDYFMSNCHKWLHVPRGCAVLYVPERNQHLMASTLPTSHGYEPKITGKRFNPFPGDSNKSAFVNNFEYMGTVDSSPYLCVPDSLRWRREVLGGEQKIYEYVKTLARRGGRRVAEILATETLDNGTGTMSDCGMVNIRLPLNIEQSVGEMEDHGTISREEAPTVTSWMMTKMILDYKTFMSCFIFQDQLWARLSSQVYLEMDDFEWAGETLLKLCQRVERREHRATR